MSLISSAIAFGFIVVAVLAILIAFMFESWFWLVVGGGSMFVGVSVLRGVMRSQGRVD